jgi:enterochelin esterase-like enzyme
LGSRPWRRHRTTRDDRRCSQGNRRTVRPHEYSPGFDPELFAAHETFFVEDVRRWVNSRFGVTLPAERTAVCGVSASGELALVIGLRHLEV